MFLFVLVCPLVGAQLRQAKKVLLLEDQTSAPASVAIANELIPTLDAKSVDPIEYFRESLDTILVPDENYQREVREWYERKYTGHQLDLIITIGPESHEFVRSAHEEFFPAVPVIFCLDQKPPDPGGGANFTGVWIDMDPVSTVNVARQLLPETKRVFVVAGTGYFDQHILKAVQEKLKGYSGVEFTYLTDLDLPSLLKQLSTLPKNGVILFLTVTRDRSLNHLFARDSVRLVSTTANVPVFGMIDAMVAQGLVGGMTSVFKGQGTTAAEIAARVLGGQKPESIPAVTAENHYVFDWKELVDDQKIYWVEHLATKNQEICRFLITDS